MHILTLRIASRHIPEAGAVCGSSARTDLCGGRQVTAVPTATAPLAVKATLESAFQARDEGDDAALSSLNELLLSLIKSEDVREGVMAMMQKREPVFKGR